MSEIPTSHPSSDLRWMVLTAPLLALVGSLLLTGSAAVWVAKRPVFDWRLIRIDGDVERNSLATLRANALPNLRGNFLTLDLQRARQAFEAVPWVRHARVQRVWPGQLRVTLEEHRPVAYWDGRGDWGEAAPERALLNSYGEVFQANLGDVEDEALPVLAGPQGTAPKVQQLWQQLQAVSQPLGERVVRLELTGRGSWRLAWEGGAQVELGRGEPQELTTRYRRFAEHSLAVARRLQTQVASADLRHAEGYALKLAGVTVNPNLKSNKRKP
ncbi:cell division protein FtsQ/DivIB [Inhella gelatinilytica]|uniref:Cell division protein FtsQ n=1 Tax=Inhella gelatinilytica TaxID=2795030 RepID=A0A931ND94_9BURK|nr:cell division protein FtsQ/DivIB [Inhella gelatinilytica]MBH9552364.1 cell division protein FtsQ/DivIB [Inhella gelatinilytica]